MAGGYLTPVARKVLSFMQTHGHISAGRAWEHLDQLPSGSLTRRITEIKDAGYLVDAERTKNPVNSRPYTRYFLRSPL